VEEVKSAPTTVATGEEAELENELIKLLYLEVDTLRAQLAQQESELDSVRREKEKIESQSKALVSQYQRQAVECLEQIRTFRDETKEIRSQVVEFQTVPITILKV